MAVLATPPVVTAATHKFPLIGKILNNSHIQSFVIHIWDQLKLAPSVRITKLCTADFSNGCKVFYKWPQKIVNVRFHLCTIGFASFRVVISPDNDPSGPLFS